MAVYLHKFNTEEERNSYALSCDFRKPFVSAHVSGSTRVASYNSSADNYLYSIFNGHAFVDLGLTSHTLWAACNVGASSPEDYGGYYAWAETSEKSGANAYAANWSDYKYGTFDNFTKYNATDDKTVLDLEDDAARVVMGGLWRMPNDSQVRELRALSSVWTTLNGVYGRLFTGNNGNTLFIPAAGYKNSGSVNNAGTKCYMWTCNGGGREGASGAGYFTFDAGGTDVLVRGRCDGNSCRGILIMPS